MRVNVSHLKSITSTVSTIGRLNTAGKRSGQQQWHGGRASPDGSRLGHPSEKARSRVAVSGNAPIVFPDGGRGGAWLTVVVVVVVHVLIVL